MSDNAFQDGDYKAYRQPSCSKPGQTLPSHDPVKLQDEVQITSQNISGHKVIIRSADPSKANGYEVIAKEKAVCRFCFGVLKEEKVLKACMWMHK